MTESSVYRLGRGPALLGTGVSLIVAAIFVLIAFLAAADDLARSWLTVVTGGLALVALVVAARFALRPPAVVRMTPVQFAIARPRRSGAWDDVEAVTVQGGVVVLAGSGPEATLDLTLVDPTQRDQLVREIYDRLNAANGYTRFA